MTEKWCMTIGVVVMAGLSAGPAPAAEQPVDLKVTRVALFSSGVGFFEREATVSGSAEAELKFRTQQINDILKSLVVQDLGGGSVGVVSYASKDPLERTLKSFAVDLTAVKSMADLLGQLRGEPVTIAGPRQMAGTIVSVEEKKILLEKDQQITIHYLNVLTDSGLQQLRLDQLQGVSLANEKLAAELKQALATLATGHDADKKSVTVRFEGDGRRQVKASFLLESPIWKTSYRLVLDAKEKPFLQGWATVENATEEDWKDVRLSLVSGRPISFQMDLYTPIYIPRPREDLELYASLRAPQFESGELMKNVMADLPAEGRELAEAESRLAPAATPAPAMAGRAPARPTASARDAVAFRGLALKGLGVQSVAAAQEAGELFEYVIQTPVSIARQNSAMLPIVNEEVAGEKVSIFNPGSHPKYPLNGLIMENTTSLHLTQGPVTLFDDGVYAGDAKLPDLKAGEKRMIAYALDLSREVLIDQKPHPVRLVSLRIAKGTLWQQHKHIDERVYTIRNKDDEDRSVIIEQPYSQEWKLAEPKEPWERTQNILRFRLTVPAKKSAAQTVRIEHIAEQSVALAEAGFDAIQLWLKTPDLSPALQQALEKVVALRIERDQVARQLAERDKEAKEAVEEQARVRENLKTLQQNSDPYARQLKKFDALETQIEQLRGQITELRGQVEQKSRALETYLLSLTVE